MLASQLLIYESKLRFVQLHKPWNFTFYTTSYKGDT